MAISLFIKADANVNPKYILITSHTSLTFSDEKSVDALKKCKTCYTVQIGLETLINNKNKV